MQNQSRELASISLVTVASLNANYSRAKHSGDFWRARFIASAMLDQVRSDMRHYGIDQGMPDGVPGNVYTALFNLSAALCADKTNEQFEQAMRDLYWVCLKEFRNMNEKAEAA